MFSSTSSCLLVPVVTPDVQSHTVQNTSQIHERRFYLTINCSVTTGGPIFKEPVLLLEVTSLFLPVSEFFGYIRYHWQRFLKHFARALRRPAASLDTTLLGGGNFKPQGRLLRCSRGGGIAKIFFFQTDLLCGSCRPCWASNVPASIMEVPGRGRFAWLSGDIIMRNLSDYNMVVDVLTGSDSGGLVISGGSLGTWLQIGVWEELHRDEKDEELADVGGKVVSFQGVDRQRFHFTWIYTLIALLMEITQYRHMLTSASVHWQ